MTSSTRFVSGGHAQRDDLPIFNLELAFRLSPESPETRRRRLILLNESMKATAHQDRRLLRWSVTPIGEDGWVQVRAVVRTAQPGVAAALGEQWMASAIAAANLAADPAAARVPDQREVSASSIAVEPGPELTSQVSAAVNMWQEP